MHCLNNFIIWRMSDAIVCTDLPLMELEAHRTFVSVKALSTIMGSMMYSDEVRSDASKALLALVATSHACDPLRRSAPKGGELLSALSSSMSVESSLDLLDSSENATSTDRGDHDDMECGDDDDDGDESDGDEVLYEDEDDDDDDAVVEVKKKRGRKTDTPETPAQSKKKAKKADDGYLGAQIEVRFVNCSVHLFYAIPILII